MSALLCKSRFVFVFGLFLLVTAVTAEARSLPDFVGLVKQNSPAVVNISTTQHKTASSKFRHNFRIPDLPEDSPFNEFFERFFGEGQGGGELQHARSETGIGRRGDPGVNPSGKIGLGRWYRLPMFQ